MLSRRALKGLLHKSHIHVHMKLVAQGDYLLVCLDFAEVSEVLMMSLFRSLDVKSTLVKACYFTSILLWHLWFM